MSKIDIDEIIHSQIEMLFSMVAYKYNLESGDISPLEDAKICEAEKTIKQVLETYVKNNLKI